MGVVDVRGVADFEIGFVPNSAGYETRIPVPAVNHRRLGAFLGLRAVHAFVGEFGLAPSRFRRGIHHNFQLVFVGLQVGQIRIDGREHSLLRQNFTSVEEYVELIVYAFGDKIQPFVFF